MKTSFAVWLEYTGLSITQAAEMLDLKRNRVAAYKRGRTNKPVMSAIPDRRTRLAMAAIAMDVEPWPEEFSKESFYSQDSEANIE